ncbi:hypothetical protein GJAV_G00102190 [Gymnothorax javanicus]|nr:hypothetical protein GJAV_G00102190 [Gymnothorax javanicus]
MDQRTQGGTSSLTPPPPTAPPPAEREKEGGGGKKEEEKREGSSPEAGSGGAEGGGDQQQFSIKETNYSEGNVKLKIGLQAKRMKKPPKILENYVCRPAIRTSVRPGRGGGRGCRGGGGVTGTSGAHAPLHEGDRDRSATLHPAQNPPSVPSPPAPAPPPPAPAAPPACFIGSPPGKRGPPKLARKSEAKSHPSVERPVNLHRPAPEDGSTAPQKKSAPPLTGSSPPSPHALAPPALSAQGRKEGGVSDAASKPPQNLLEEHQREKNRGVLNRGSITVTEKLAQLMAICPPSKCTKGKVRKIPSPSAVNVNSTTAPTIPSSSRTDHSLLNKASGPAALLISQCPRPPAGVSRPPGRPPGSRNKDSILEKFSTPSKKEEGGGDGKRGNHGSANGNINPATGNKSNNNSSGVDQQPPLAYQPVSSSPPKLSSDQRAVGTLDGRQCLASSQSRNGPTQTAERSENEAPSDLSKGAALLKPSRRDSNFKRAASPPRGAGRKSLSPKSRSSSRDRCTAAPSEPARRTSSPADLSSASASPSPLKETANLFPSSPPEQECVPLKKRKGRRPRWTRVVNRTQRPTQACSADNQLCKSPLTSPAALSTPPLKRRPVGRPPNPNRVPPAVSQLFGAPPRKRGRPKSKMPRLDASQPGCTIRMPPSKVCSLLKSKEEQDPPVLHPEVDLNPPRPMPKKRGRPKRLPQTYPRRPSPQLWPWKRGEVVGLLRAKVRKQIRPSIRKVMGSWQ